MSVVGKLNEWIKNIMASIFNCLTMEKLHSRTKLAYVSLMSFT